jgi:hypothetical protein
LYANNAAIFSSATISTKRRFDILIDHRPDGHGFTEGEIDEALMATYSRGASVDLWAVYSGSPWRQSPV